MPQMEQGQRRIGGKIYYHAFSFSHLSDAKGLAQRLRKRGLSARIIRKKNGAYDVYER